MSGRNTKKRYALNYFVEVEKDSKKVCFWVQNYSKRLEVVFFLSRNVNKTFVN